MYGFCKVSARLLKSFCKHFARILLDFGLVSVAFQWTLSGVCKVCARVPSDFLNVFAMNSCCKVPIGFL